MKRIVCALSFLLISFCAHTSFAWVEWNYTGGSHSWNNTANWGGTIPNSASDPIMRGQGAGFEAEI
ncbi:MAG: hypothetical protein A2Y10_05375 [Planctomycetes bacterium GWF2_41_51]|nr:MAG: hypothetical protein A2Y10_05375 [Planctomycetes bacterium GWF2_41_51]HBG26811.1 hypothetical protein [Phycisphaerales bacterium]